MGTRVAAAIGFLHIQMSAIGARWFRLIVNGLVHGHEEYEQIKATRWFVDNSVTQLQDECHLEPCDIRSVKAYGPKTAPMFSNLS